MAKNIFTREQEILLAKVSDMSEDTKAAAEAGKVVISDVVYFKRADISGKSALVNVLKNDDSIVDGVCNISKQKVDSGENILINRVSVRAAASTTATTVQGVKYSTIASMTDPAVVNAELEILVKQNKIFGAPLSEFCQENGKSGVASNILLTSPKLVTDADELQFRLKFPDGSTVDTTSSNKTYIEVAIAGCAIRTI